MLRKFTVKNFKCIKNEIKLDFRKTNYKFLEQNTCGKVLKGALFVGDHASGKSTLLQAVRLLPELLFWQDTCDMTSYQCIFSEENVSKLTYEFDIDGHDLVYSFAISGNSFADESLQLDGRILIERLGEKSKWITGNGTILCDVDASELFLKRISRKPAFSDSDILGKLLAYLKKTIYIDTYTRRIAVFDGESLCAEKYAKAHGTERMNDFLQEYQFPYLLRYNEGEQGIGQLFFERKGSSVPIPASMESSGNRTFINILPAVFRVTETGGMLLIDPFGGGMHNKLEELLIKYVMKQGTNTQLFLASHSTNLLSNSLLRPDQIVAVERAVDVGTSLHRFSDEQPRVAQNLEKMYLSGVFGGLPSYISQVH